MYEKCFYFLTVFLFFSCEKKEKQEYLKTFDWVVKTFEENDAGVPVVLAIKGEKNYQEFTKHQRKKISKAKDEEEFVKIVNEWLCFFRKGHHAFIPKKNSPLDDLINQMGDTPTIPQFRPYFKKLNERTAYLCIPTALINYKPLIDNLVQQNEDIIKSIPNLIVDIRNNGGGTSNSFESVLFYMYTNPLFSHIQEIRATEVNVEAMELGVELARKIDDKNLEKIRLHTIEKMQENLGNFFSLSQQNDIIDLGYPIFSNPQKIAILVNRGTGSASEGFVNQAKQSFKVKVFGTSTSGCVDIANQLIVDSPDKKYQLYYGITRETSALYNPIDDVGYQPDFLITNNIPEEEWVEYVQKILEYGQ